MTDKIITQDFLHEYFNYIDGKLFYKKKLAINSKNKIGNEVGYLTDGRYKSVVIFQKRYYLHRLIFLFHHGHLPKIIDHIDGNILNNKIENLRSCTQQQNTFNSKCKSNNKTGIKNICWNKTKNKYEVFLSVNKKSKYFGSYNDIDYAIFIADAMRHKYHKEYYRT
jgi:hypothetical protein